MRFRLECRKLLSTVIHHRITAHRRRTVRFRQLLSHDLIRRHLLVVRRPIHIRILRNPLLPSLATDQCATHRASYYT